MGEAHSKHLGYRGGRDREEGVEQWMDKWGMGAMQWCNAKHMSISVVQRCRACFTPQHNVQLCYGSAGAIKDALIEAPFPTFLNRALQIPCPSCLTRFLTCINNKHHGSMFCFHVNFKQGFLGHLLHFSFVINHKKDCGTCTTVIIKPITRSKQWIWTVLCPQWQEAGNKPFKLQH